MVAAPEPIVVRPLSPGEWVDYSELGVEGLELSGESVRVAVHEGGEPTVVSLAVEQRNAVKRFAFAALALDQRVNLGPREIRFVRKYLAMQQTDFADAVGIEMERLLAIEDASALPTRVEVSRVRATILISLMRMLKAQNPGEIVSVPVEALREPATDYIAVPRQLFAVRYIAGILSGEAVCCAEGLAARIKRRGEFEG